MFKKIFIGTCCVIVVVLLMGCTWTVGGIDYSRIGAVISQDYYENFDAMEYTLDSFNLTNAKKIEYRYMPVFSEDEEAEESLGERFFLINLKKTGKKYAKSALEHVTQLEFIDRVHFCYHGSYNGELFK